MTRERKDQLYATPADEITGFRFDHSVVEVFPDMIQRSVPGYTTIVHMIGQMAERYAQPGTRCYDLGCSLGAGTLAMRHRIVAAGVKIVAVDNSPAMVDQCQKVINADSGEIPVELLCADLQNVEIENASVCILNFTLQFIPVAARLSILKRIHNSLVPGGVLILSEKIAFNEAQHHQLMIDLHHNFKRAQGYSELEIAQKRAALENVLVPESADAHRDRLTRAGFTSTDLWFQCFNFASFVAFK